MSVNAPGPFFTLTSLGLPSSQAEFMALWLAQMQAAFPGYNPNPASLEYLQAQVFASWAEDEAQLCSNGATELFRQFGVSLLQVPYQIGTSAQAIVTVTAQDIAGYTLPQGTQLTLTLGGTQVAFQTASTLNIPNGSSSANAVAIAVQAGSSPNGAGTPASLVSQITWVADVTVVASATGGVDQENDGQYVQRLAGALQLLSPKAVTADDFARLALNFSPASGTDQQQVGRATSIDGYDPGAGTYNNENEVTVCVTDATGEPLSSDTLAAVQTFLEARRLVCTVVNTVSPNYSTIYVAVTVQAASGYPIAAVQANVQTALLSYLSPQNFALPQRSITGWENQTSIYQSEVIAVIQNTVGVAHVSTPVAIDVNSNPTNTGDLTLAGPFPLVQSTTSSIPTSAITVTT